MGFIIFNIIFNCYEGITTQIDYLMVMLSTTYTDNVVLHLWDEESMLSDHWLGQTSWKSKLNLNICISSSIFFSQVIWR